ncbi:MAG: hypothetical protein LAO76_01020 [Acidobacteriia bacterium]|nr:hypothetical protein [Terriglobia bacterium]
MKSEAEISHLWQLAHLKFYFGEKLAEYSMQSVDNSAIEFALDPEAESAVFGEKSAEDDAETESFPEQSRKEPVAPQGLNPSTRIA